MYGTVLAESNSENLQENLAGQTENFGLNAYLLSKALFPAAVHKITTATSKVNPLVV